jgi:hypothetical protein
MNKRMWDHPEKRKVKASVLSATIKREHGRSGGKISIDDAAMLVQVDTLLPAELCCGKLQHASRGQVVLCVGGFALFDVPDTGRHGANATLLLNLAAAAARVRYTQHSTWSLSFAIEGGEMNQLVDLDTIALVSFA